MHAARRSPRSTYRRPPEPAPEPLYLPLLEPPSPELLEDQPEEDSLEEDSLEEQDPSLIVIEVA